MRTKLRRGLTDAIKGKDRVAVSAIRSALAAIDNSEAPSVEHQALPVAGVGSTEIDRLELTDADVQAIVEAEVRQRTEAADEYAQLGRDDQATRLRAEAEVLRRYLPDS
ncbi:GatB/YqeY domain-containing protein [Amycolatopsis albispora]|uniref:Glutamyl-tRNA amidotransferase n=1 Tax=Amycolatopsis albispora TaxID=1804986 RepID=A0A344L7T0_9PSEU|nr:GatB/YqeY domain-containing protein [Amycolatopsis albispora]AXB44104.1 hypothetical protein A4R43_17540 [Amycolatopsis albispora]